MAKPVFRNPDKVQQTPERDWIREHLPTGPDGLISEDLDLVMRTYGARYHTDARGRFILVELKHGQATLGTSKRKTFGLIDETLAQGDPDRKRYLGFFVLNYETGEWDRSGWFTVNGVSITRCQLAAFLQLDGATLDYIRDNQQKPPL